MLLVYSRIELLDQQKAKCFIQAWYLYLWGELLRSTLKHFAHTFLSFASVVTHFPSCALDFSHFSFEISTWGLATWWSALSFPAHHQVGFSSETFDIFLFFWAWVYCRTCWPLAFFLSQYFIVVTYGLFLSTVLCPQGSTPSCLFHGFWFWLCCYPAVTIAAWITAPQSMDHFSSVCLFLIFSALTLFQT